MLRKWIVVSLALAAMACQPKPQQAASKGEPPALPGDVKAVSAVATTNGTNGGSAIPDPQVENGKLLVTGEFISPQVSDVATKIPGRVGHVYVDEGQRVKAGQPLLEIERDYLELDVRNAQASLERAQAVEAQAKRELERKKGLLAKHSIPESVFDQVQSAWEQSKAALDSAQVGLDTARQRLSDAILRSPFDGVVVEKRTAPGEHLGDATVAFVVAQTAPLRLRFNVSEQYLTAVEEGQDVSATVEAYPGETFTGRIDVIGRTIDPANRTFFLEVTFPNKDGRLRPGLFARTEIELLQRKAEKG